jgi:putative drug exporter of the RND superfamily
MVMVPATMELLGDRNWWLPGWLNRLLPDIHVEGREVVDAEITPRPIDSLPPADRSLVAP